MILKRFLNLTFQPRGTAPFLSNTYLLSSKKDKQPQPQAAGQPEQTQNVEVPPQQQAAQAVDTAGVQQVQQPQFVKNFKQFQSPTYTDQYEHDLAYDFMVKKAQPLDVVKLYESIKHLSNPQQIQSAIDQAVQASQKSQKQPLLSFQRHLNLSLESLTRSTINLNGQRHDQKATQSQTIDFKKLKLSEYKIKYRQGLYQNYKYYENIDDLVKAVDANVNKNGYYNLLYSIVRQNWDYGAVFAAFKGIGVGEIVDRVRVGVYEDVNVLKFFWSVAKINPKYSQQYTSQILKQLTKLQINDHKNIKLLKSLPYFYLGKETSQQMLQKIIQRSKNLQQTLKLWTLFLSITSRIKIIQQSSQNWQQSTINFNDIFNYCQQVKNFKQFIYADLPKTLFENKKLAEYQIYKKAIGYYEGNSKKMDGLLVGELEKTVGLNFGKKSSKGRIFYRFQGDPLDVETQFSQKQVEKVSFGEKMLIESIVKGKYQKALDYYANNLCHQPEHAEQLLSAHSEAIRLFDQKDSQALYTLKNIIANSTKRFNVANFMLNQRKLDSFLHNTIRQRPRQWRDQDRTGQPAKKLWNSKKQVSDQNVQQNPQNVEQNVAQNASEGEHEQNEAKVVEKPRQKKGLFVKKTPAHSFSTIKDQFPKDETKDEKSDTQYQNYRRVVKETQKSVQQQKKPQKQQKSTVQFNFKDMTNLKDIQNQFQRKLPQINQSNIEQILYKSSFIPVVNSMYILIKYYFLQNNPTGTQPQNIKDLNAQFMSSFGQVSKNYAQYLKGCIFMFAMPDRFYLDMLDDQVKKGSRLVFKKIVAHILLFKKNLSDALVEKICQICQKQKIGLTLLEIISLINIREITVSSQSLKRIASSVQNFKNMEADLIQFVRKYCDRTNNQMQTKLFQPYIKNLTFTERYQALNSFLQILQKQFKPKQYKINPKLSVEDNLKADKLHKQKQTERVNKQLFEMIRIVSQSLKPRTEIPTFVGQMFDVYMNKKKGPIKAQEFAVGLTISSQNPDKFLELLNKLKQSGNQNNQLVFNSLIRSIMTFGRDLKDQVQRIMKATLYERQFDLNQQQLKNFGFIFKQLDIPTPYIEFLEYVLKKQPPINQEIKSLYYKVFNRTTDDYSKNQISGLLDYIFNPSREKDRVEYKKVKLQEERKQKILKEMGQRKPESRSQEIVYNEDKSVDKQGKKQVEEASKQKKKTKKQQKSQKKGKSTEKKTQQKLQKGAKKVQIQPANKSLQVINPQKINAKKQLKGVNKISAAFAYDMNKRFVYHQKLWKRDLRKQSTVMFVQNFLSNFDGAEQQITKPEVRNKKLKQQQKQAKKKQSKQSKK